MSSLFQAAASSLWSLKTDFEHPDRITEDEQGVLAALAIALRADCTRRRVGALVTDTRGRVIGTGRNGAPPARPGCFTEGACPRGQTGYDEVPAGARYDVGGQRCIALHAEANALLWTEPNRRVGGTIYISDRPCDDCSLALAGSGLARAVWPEQSEDGTWLVRSLDIATAPVGGHYA